jgi:hypothetical protein
MTWPISSLEERLRAGSWHTLPVIGLADDVGHLMAEVIQSVSLDPIEDGADEDAELQSAAR